MKYRGFSPAGDYCEGVGHATLNYVRVQGRSWLLGKWLTYVIWRSSYGSPWRNMEGGAQMPDQARLDELSYAYYAWEGLAKIQREQKEKLKKEAA